MIENSIHTKIESNTTISWIEDGIFKQYYKPGTVIDLKTEKENIQDRLLLSNNIPQLVLVDARNVVYWTWDAKKYSFSKEATSLIQAAALIGNSQILITSWLWATKFFDLKIPTRLFKTHEEGIEWLEKFK